MKTTKTNRASKQSATRRPVRASRAAVRRRAIKADEELDEEIVDLPDDLPAPDIDDGDFAPDEGEAEVIVDEEATELLFEAEDVAELVSEVTGLPVEVTVDEDEVVFAVGDDEFTVTPEGDEEIVEQSTRMKSSARKIAASQRVRRPARRVAASRTDRRVRK